MRSKMTPQEMFEFKSNWIAERSYFSMASPDYHFNLQLCKDNMAPQFFKVKKNEFPDDTHLFMFHRREDYEFFKKYNFGQTRDLS